MKIRATTKYRNDVVIKRREKLKMSQRDYAQFLSVPVRHIEAIESMSGVKVPKDNYTFTKSVSEVSVDVGVAEEEIWPNELYGSDFNTTSIRVADVSPKELECELKHRMQQIECDPAKIAEEQEGRNIGIDGIMEMLRNESYRTRTIVEMLYGLGDDRTRYTLEEAGRVFNIDREHVRQISMKFANKAKTKNINGLHEHEILKIRQYGNIVLGMNEEDMDESFARGTRGRFRTNE